MLYPLVSTLMKSVRRWGSQEDDVTLQGQLEVVEPNTLREKPKRSRSRALKLTWPPGNHVTAEECF